MSVKREYALTLPNSSCKCLNSFKKWVGQKCRQNHWPRTKRFTSGWSASLQNALKSPGNRRRLHADQNSLIMSAALLWINTLDPSSQISWIRYHDERNEKSGNGFLSACATEENLPGIIFWNPCPKNVGIMNPKSPYLDLVWLIHRQRGFFRCQVR